MDQKEQTRGVTKGLIDALTQRAHRLESVTAGSKTSDLQWLRDAFRNVSYVGLGEATHGTREFFQMKHRMLEFLVTEMGFRVFAIEAPYAGCLNINDYVLYGKGDAYSALASQSFWTWDTEEVIALIEWIRRYNQSVSADRRIEFHGIDIQSNAKGGGIDRVQAYLLRVDPAFGSARSEFFSSVKLFDMDRSKKADGLRDQWHEMMESMTNNKENYIRLTSQDEFNQISRLATVVFQMLDAFGMRADDPRRAEREWRDYYMAENLNALVAHAGSKAKIVVWGHNAHMSADAGADVNMGQRPLGSYLRAAYGERYFAMGFAFNEGGFQACQLKDGRLVGLKEVRVDAATTDSLDWILTQVLPNNYILNLRGNDLPNCLKSWVNTEIMQRSYGAVADQAGLEDAYYPVTVGRAFDAIIFIHKTTRASPTKTGLR